MFPASQFGVVWGYIDRSSRVGVPPTDMVDQQWGAAVVTGAGRGIGRALAIELARLGYPVGIQARSEAALHEVQTEIEQQGGRALVVPGDVTRSDAAAALVDRTTKEFGALRVAVACAGQALSTPVLQTEAPALDALFQVNTVGPFHLVKAAARSMVNGGVDGRIVVVASTASVKAFRYTAAYTTSKHAVLGLVRTAALELASHGITVNAICPGWVDTDLLAASVDNIADKTDSTPERARRRIEKMIPMGEILSPEEVAGLLAYLVSPAARHMTGQALVLDGGETL